MSENEIQNNLFGLGKLNSEYANVFDGQSYLNSLVNKESNIDVAVANVTFEPGCRNYWHIHHHGFQILLVTAGNGWYQEFGKPAKLLKPGDVVVIHEGIKHWHGATKNSWFAHVAITKGESEWCGPVSDEQYDQLEEGK